MNSPAAPSPPLSVRDMTSPEAMEQLGRAFGERLRAMRLERPEAQTAGEPTGVVVGLEGDLGAGKTTFVRGLVAGVTGFAQTVTSPTFQLMNLYRPAAPGGAGAAGIVAAPAPGGDSAAARTVAHIDAYRLHGAQEFAELGLADLLEEGVVIVVEWPSRTRHPIFEQEAIYLRFSHVAETVRRVELLRLPAGVAGMRL